MRKTVTFAGFIFLLLMFLSNTLQSQYYFNRAITLPGTAGNYAVTDPGTNLSITGDITIECWVNQAVNTGAQIVVQKRLGTGATGYTIYLTGGRLAFRTAGTTRLTGATIIPLNVWTHLAATYNVATNTFFVYINGVQDGTIVTAGAAPPADTDSLRIGIGFNSPFNGMVDEVRIWNVTRTLSEIQASMRIPLGESGAIYPGLVSSWRLNNNGTDEINGYTAYLRGTAAYVLTGNNPGGYTAFNTGIALNGVVGSYVAAPDIAPLNITGSFTLECWVNPVNSTAPSFQNIIAKRVSGANGYELYINAGRVTVRTNGTTRVSGTTVLPNNVWSHCAVTFNSTNNTFMTYVNGVSDGNIVAAGTPVTNADSLYIGRGINSPFAGMVDEVRICNYTKTTEEIQRSMYLSIDAGNEPPPNSNTNIAYSYEGNLTGTDGSSRGNFRGGTRFTNVFLLTTDSPPPSNRHDAGSFGTGYRFRSPNLPFGAAPTSVSDSIFMPEGLTINDVNVFVGINHSYTNDISVTLRNPSGSTSRILYAGNAPDNGDHMITIFDDQADSTANANMRGPWSPRVRPVNNLAIFNGQNAGGYWRITVTDIFPGADDGRLIGWGIQFNNQAITAVNEEITGIPKKFALHQNYPNPFNPTTTIKYDLAKESFVKITVYDILGKQVQTLVNEQKKAGSYALEINASGLASGVYFYKIEAGTFVATKKMMLIK